MHKGAASAEQHRMLATCKVLRHDVVGKMTENPTVKETDLLDECVSAANSLKVEE